MTNVLDGSHQPDASRRPVPCRAVAQIGASPATADPDRARTGGVTLGSRPSAFADVRLAAAVLAAVRGTAPSRDRLMLATRG